MGGVKKKSMASMEKQQEAQDEEQAPGQPQKGKKAEKKAAPQQQKRLPFLAPRMSESEMIKALGPLKAITLHSAARALGVNASIAANSIRELEGKHLLVKVGGFSGHFVWSVPEK
jgi:small subunit ribosomal protein S25e